MVTEHENESSQYKDTHLLTKYFLSLRSQSRGYKLVIYKITNNWVIETCYQVYLQIISGLRL